MSISHNKSVITTNSNNQNNSHRSTVSATTTGGGVGGGGASTSGGGAPTQACAACKYQRRKCHPDCTLAPYFPADHQRQFLNAHRLFGVSNILKTLQKLDAEQRPAAMRTIIFQSNMRAQDPVLGCYRIVFELQEQISRYSAELDMVLRQLAFYRAQAQNQMHQQDPQQEALPEINIPTSNIMDPNINQINQSMTANIDDHDDLDHIYAPTLQQQQQQQQQQLYYYYYGGGGDRDNNNNSNSNSNHYGGDIGAPPLSSLTIGGVGHQHQEQREDDVKPLVDMFNVSDTTKVEIKEPSDSMEHVQEHDLKGAASLFTLTHSDTSGV